MWVTHWTQKTEMQSLTRWVYCMWSHGRGSRPAAEWWMKELGKLETQKMLCFTKDLHFTSMQYARILHEGFLTTIYGSRFGTSGKKQMPNCVMWSRTPTKVDLWNCLSGGIWKMTVNECINVKQIKQSLKYCGLEKETGINMICIAKNCQDLTVMSYNKTLYTSVHSNQQQRGNISMFVHQRHL